MGKKTLAVVGVVVSAAFIYFCVENKKDAIALKCNAKKVIQKITGNQTETTDEPITEVKEPSADIAKAEVKKSEPAAIFEKSDPAFGMTVDDVVNVVGMFAPGAKEGRLIHFIDTLCSRKECLNDLRYSDDIKKIGWDKEMIQLIQYMLEAHVEKGSIYVNSNILHIEGKIASEAEKQRLDEIITALKKQGLQIEDKTVAAYEQSGTTEAVEVASAIGAAPKKSEKEVSSETDETAVAEPAAKPAELAHETLKEEKKAQMPKAAVVETPVVKEVHAEKPAPNVQQMAEEHPTVTEKSGDLKKLEEALVSQIADRAYRLSEVGEKTIDRIAELLHARGAQKIGVSVYVHQGKDKLVNMIIAQKRADILKKALRKRGFRDIVANGAAAEAGSDRIEIRVIK